MTTPHALYKARQVARHAALTLARDAGAPVIARPVFRGAQASVHDVGPLAGMHAARQIELGARHAALDYIRQAREAGHNWHDIGTALGLVPGGDAQQAGETIAEAALRRRSPRHRNKPALRPVLHLDLPVVRPGDQRPRADQRSRRRRARPR